MAEGHTAIDWSEIRQLVAGGYVSARRHPTEPLTIYNYTARCQYDGHWTPMTRQCRGLIADDSGQVVARPFPKFFNYGDLAVGEIPDEPFDVFEKLDGSLGVLYRTADGPAIATRGSFTSEQALLATDMLRSRYAGAEFLDGCTYLFEIIYPENRIVVDYGGESRLVLLAVIDTATGVEVDHHPGGGLELVASHVARPPAELAAMVRPNCEGFVLRNAPDCASRSNTPSTCGSIGC
ncbi:MAG: hypothetical protein IT175_12190 [Acidobacteria bacterium]|nr:hypothetical protein [Acidobacteriota bacterium]